MGKRIWIGLVNIIPNDNCKVLDKNEGAFTNILTLAATEEEYRLKIRKVLKEYNLKVVEIEDEEPLIERQKKMEIDKEIYEMSQDEFNDETVKLGTFHTYDLK
jgi:hypothetical protein